MDINGSAGKHVKLWSPGEASVSGAEEDVPQDPFVAGCRLFFLHFQISTSIMIVRWPRSWHPDGGGEETAQPWRVALGKLPCWDLRWWGAYVGGICNADKFCAMTFHKTCPSSSSAAEELFLTFSSKIPGLGGATSRRDLWAFFTLSLIPGSPSTLVNHE